MLKRAKQKSWTRTQKFTSSFLDYLFSYFKDNCLGRYCTITFIPRKIKKGKLI